jgi:hypothetical protein
MVTKYCPYLCGLVVRVPGYTTEMYCVSCEVRTEFIYVLSRGRFPGTTKKKSNGSGTGSTQPREYN